MEFAEDQDMIQAVAPERPDQALDIWILPARLGCPAVTPICAVISGTELLALLGRPCRALINEAA